MRNCGEMVAALGRVRITDDVEQMQGPNVQVT